jgi:hypothetical protein
MDNRTEGDNGAFPMRGQTSLQWGLSKREHIALNIMCHHKCSASIAVQETDNLIKELNK